jgi:acetylornithine deacetylase/succinyl-diaminopimelate desuccinylase-like protein
MAAPELVTIDLRFTTSEDPEQVAERVREAVRMIVGRDALDHFRWRTESLEPKRDRIRPR